MWLLEVEGTREEGSNAARHAVSRYGDFKMCSLDTSGRRRGGTVRQGTKIELVPPLASHHALLFDFALAEPAGPWRSGPAINKPFHKTLAGNHGGLGLL